nr:potassium transporter KtrB [Lachnospiraceae bacterium]
MDVAEKNEKKLRRQMRTTSKILLGFLLAILTGAVLLTLPVATVSGKSDFLTALFTATTSVCVTGLVVVPTFSYWTLFGKIVILALIQLGGLGIVALTSFVMLLMNRKFSLRNRMMIQDAFGLSTMQGMVVFIKRVIKGTVIVEMLGAVLYMFAFIPQFGVAHGIWYSVFNAISAFCNAGIDIIGPDSLMTYADSPLVLLTSSFLIICGGLGFVVWWDVVDVLSNVRAKKIPARDIWRRFNTHTKIILMMTFALILSGMVVTFLFECNNPLTLGNMSLGKKMLNAFFQSVTLRTAGFASISQKGLTEPTVLVSCVIMFIGGSPVGTAGGIKTMTAATLVFAVLAVVQGRKETVAFKKTIPTS